MNDYKKLIGDIDDLLIAHPSENVSKMYLRKAADAIKQLITNGVTVQEWISVNDRLPEESGNYIVCCDDSSCSYGEGIWYSSDVVVVSEYYEGSWIWYEGGTEWSLENIVTHWMPLPQPPKGE